LRRAGVVNPHLASWARLDPAVMRRALVVGCGYGDDAQWLAARGCAVTAFDISPTAVAAARARFPASPVDYQAADLLSLPAAWAAEPFDLVVEAYTLQILPPGSPERAAAPPLLRDLRARRVMPGPARGLLTRGADCGSRRLDGC
jgi:SAM-dependent methyltransferase